MRHVSKRDAMRDLSKYLNDMYYWCDVNGEYFAKDGHMTGMVSVSRDTVKKLRQLMDAILEADANDSVVFVADGYDSVYAQLCGKAKA